MSSALAQYSDIAVMPSAQHGIRQFCPLIIYHDNPSEQLEKTLNTNKQYDRTAIDRHREKTNEMLEHNAQFWNEKFNTEFEADYLDKDIKVSPSTSTTSNISSSSSSSGDSVATIEHPLYQRMMEIPAIKTTPNSNYFATTIEEEKYYSMMSKGHSNSKPAPCNISTLPVSPTCSMNTPLIPTATTATTVVGTSKDTSVKRRRGNLPKEVTEFLRKWLIQHKKHPYPAEKEKADLARHTGLTVNQISNWFINARRRILQPMLESENLTAQMMAYPEMVNHHQQPITSAFMEPSRRRRHDFYTYQRDFVSTTRDHPSPPQHYQHYHPSMHHHYQYLPHEQPYHYPHHYHSEQQDQEHASRYRRTRLMDPNDHYHQLSMR